MVYEKPLEELSKISRGLRYSFLSQENLEKEFKQMIFEEATYYEACIFLKQHNIPKKFPEIQKAEHFYNKGEIHKANRILYDFWNELETLSSIEPRDIKYFGN